MCGRYQTPDEDGVEVRPGDETIVETAQGKKRLHWGVKLQKSSRLIINARSETAQTKPLFRTAMQQGRCIVAASRFFEWDAKKRCHAFTSGQNETLYMAGLYLKTNDGKESLVILTQAARNGCEKVHSRMPCLLPSAEYRYLWLHDNALSPELLCMDAPLTIQQVVSKEEQLHFLP